MDVERYKYYCDEARIIDNSIRELSDGQDKFVLTIASGGIVFAISFVGSYIEYVKRGDGVGWLYVSLVALVIALIFYAITYVTCLVANKRNKRTLEAWYKSGTTDSPIYISTIGRVNNVLHFGSLLSLIFGIASLAWFCMSVLLNTMNKQNEVPLVDSGKAYVSTTVPVLPPSDASSTQDDPSLVSNQDDQ